MMFLLLLAAGGVAVSQQPSSPPQKPADSRDTVDDGADPQNSLGWPFIKHLAQDQKQFWVDGAAKWNKKKAEHFLPFVAFTGGLIAGDSWISNQIPLRE